MEFELKKLSAGSVAAALEKVKRYRLLNEPGEAESICRDILALEPENAQATTNLILTLTDQFGRGAAGRYDEAKALVRALPDEYERAYYSGIVAERRGKAIHRQGGIGCGAVAYEWLHRAMNLFEEASRLCPECDEIALLRWNACARRIMKHTEICPDPHASTDHRLTDDY